MKDHGSIKISCYFCLTKYKVQFRKAKNVSEH